MTLTGVPARVRRANAHPREARPGLRHHSAAYRSYSTGRATLCLFSSPEDKYLSDLCTGRLVRRLLPAEIGVCRMDALLPKRTDIEYPRTVWRASQVDRRILGVRLAPEAICWIDANIQRQVLCSPDRNVTACAIRYSETRAGFDGCRNRHNVLRSLPFGPAHGSQ
jgi:hypothetical protein